MISTKAELLERMKADPTAVLEHCRGVRGVHWWWLVSKSYPEYIAVHGGAGNALRDGGLLTLTNPHSLDRCSRYKLA